jgi:hypothetical protein
MLAPAYGLSATTAVAGERAAAVPDIVSQPEEK